MDWIMLLILTAATWRLSSFFANEEGPFDVFFHIRLRARQLGRKYSIVRRFGLHEGIECEWCNSLWFGTLLVIGWLVFGSIVQWIVLPLALSTGAIIFKHVIQSLEQFQEWITKKNQDYD